MNVDPPHILARLRSARIPEHQIEAGVAAECIYCGSRRSLSEIWAANPRAISCCPERAMRAPLPKFTPTQGS